MSSLQLAVNTSLTKAQMILLKDHSFLGEVTWEKSKSHSEVITQQFQQLCKDNDVTLKQINKVYCVNGPGSFTGIRVGVNFSKTLAYSLNAPMVAINSLDLFALNCIQQDLPLITCIDAQKNSVFLSQYHFKNNKWISILENTLVPIQRLETLITEPTYFCGNGIEQYRSVINKETLNLLKECNTQQGSDLKNYFSNHFFKFEKKEVHWSEFQPVYIKASAAEEKINPTPFN